MSDLFESFKGEDINQLLRIGDVTKPVADWLWQAWRDNDESLVLDCIYLVLK